MDAHELIEELRVLLRHNSDDRDYVRRKLQDAATILAEAQGQIDAAYEAPDLYRVSRQRAPSIADGIRVLAAVLGPREGWRASQLAELSSGDKQKARRTHRITASSFRALN